MPELPEVETIRRSLIHKVVRKTINEVTLSDEARIEYIERDKLVSTLTSAQFLKVDRRAKYLLFYLDNSYVLIVHLGMTGKLLFHVKQFDPQKHDHLLIKFCDDSYLLFNDARRFGKISLMKDSELLQHKYLNQLGFEYNDQNMKSKLRQALSKRKANIKSVLLNQSVITGIGNIYASEILFDSRINPNKSSADLTLLEFNRLVKSISKILDLAIELGGSSIKDYLDGSGHKGSMQKYLKVYDRENQDCLVCKTIIIRTNAQGRSTWFCPNCQKL